MANFHLGCLSLKIFMNQTELKRNMGEGEILEQRSLAAPLIFFIVIVFQFATKRLQDLKKVPNSTWYCHIQLLNSKIVSYLAIFHNVD